MHEQSQKEDGFPVVSFYEMYPVTCQQSSCFLRAVSLQLALAVVL
jgi:hypothetical protein